MRATSIWPIGGSHALELHRNSAAIHRGIATTLWSAGKKATQLLSGSSHSRCSGRWWICSGAESFWLTLTISRDLKGRELVVRSCGHRWYGAARLHRKNGTIRVDLLQRRCAHR